jgi:hypothetical protein
MEFSEIISNIKLTLLLSPFGRITQTSNNSFLTTFPLMSLGRGAFIIPSLTDRDRRNFIKTPPGCSEFLRAVLPLWPGSGGLVANILAWYSKRYYKYPKVGDS